ncbi:MAG TPA: VWA domain-containing protein [Saprospiraceae bacterium]|nr:VWA domain-containing protein [Saprospiraceae bacterium]
MFRLESGYYLVLLAVIPLLYLLYVNYKQKQEVLWQKLGTPDTLKRSILNGGRLFKRKLILFNIVLFLSVLALTNPQFGKKKEKVKSQNVDVMLALDVSQSMLCSDIKPDRLARAQVWIKQFLDRFKSERIGFISFAGSAYLNAPLTTDLATIQLMSSMAGPKNIGTQGTAISAAIDLAVKSFGDEQGFHRIIILLTDGEDHEGEAIESAKKAAQKGISIITIPIGTTQGGPIPAFGGTGENYRTDESGQLIITKPNRKLLEEIATAGQGELLELENSEQGFDRLKNRFAQLAKKEVTYQSFSSYQSYFQYILFLALAVLIIETLTNRRKDV